MSDLRPEGTSCPPQETRLPETASAFSPAAPPGSAAMKLLVVTLVLAVFAGSPVSVFGDEPGSQWQQLKQDFLEYLKSIRLHLERQSDLLRNAEVVREVSNHASGSLFNISRRLSKLGKDMPDEVKEALDLAVGIPTGVAEKLYNAMREVSKRLEPATRDLNTALEAAVAHYAERPLEHLNRYDPMIRGRLQEIHRNQTERLKVRLQELEVLRPQIHHLLGQLHEVQVALQPFADELQEVVRQRVESAVDVARPYVKPVLESARERTVGFKKWVGNPLFVTDNKED
ncbi:uncharacterized protein LOC143837138 [Paroedura picta]|uniref:uncharacterized protein LOC143837138 n=1 Tax=Paroedura picta TaxID=143630 RepID=UPI0040569632